MGWWLLGDKSFVVGYIYMRLNFHMELYMKPIVTLTHIAYRLLDGNKNY